MSADDGIRLREIPGVNGGSYWVAYHYVGETVRDDDILSKAHLFERYQSLEQITQAYRDAAANTEYGFDISYQHKVVDSELLSAIDSTEVDSENILRSKTTIVNNPDPSIVSEQSFGQALTQLINRYSKENDSGTPDFILARYLERQLWIFTETITDRASWRGEAVELPALMKLRTELGTLVTPVEDAWFKISPLELHQGDVFRAFARKDLDPQMQDRDDKVEYVCHHVSHDNVWYGDEGTSGFIYAYWDFMKKVVNA